MNSVDPSAEQMTLTFEQALDLASRHHTTGDLSMAEDIYRQILQADPNHPDALHLLGVLSHQAGESERAVDLISKALGIRPDFAEAHNNLGNVFRELGRVEEAFTSYQKALAIKPDFAEANSNLGNALKELGQLDDAIVYYHKALAIKPDYAEAYYNLGNALKVLGNLDEAVASYQNALAFQPDYAEAHYNLGNALQGLDKLDEATASYQMALAINSNYIEAYNNIGIIQRELGHLDEAIASYQKVLAIKPDYAEAHYNLGLALQDLGRLDDAVTSCQKALDIKPELVEAHSNLALMLISSGRRSEAIDHFKRSLEIGRGDNPIDPQHKSSQFITKVKISHDIEQFRYLASQNHETERFLSMAKMYEAVEGEIDWPDDDKLAIPLSDDHRKRLGYTYNRPIHLLEAPEVSGSTLSNTLDVERITADYFSHSSGMTYFDDLLSPNTLASLRRFLLGSTIWSGLDEHGGILGAMLKDGLACPLLFQIADDLRQTFPTIFEDNQLTQLWAYKYDSRLRGSSLHADFAAINVNFWITPDTANLNPASGGLVVYEAEAPLDWNFKSYLRNPICIREFLTENNSGKTIVPYGGNRTVLFNSRLFHETDKLEFKQGYENRRINVTWLFGNRYV